MQLMVQAKQKILISFLVFICATFPGCKPTTTNSYPSTVTAEVTNPLNESRKDVAVVIPMRDAPLIKSFTIRSNEMQLAGQNVDDGILVVLDSMKPHEKRSITVYYNTVGSADSYYHKRTQAIGAAWESEKVGYFIDQNRINVLGKKSSDMMLMGLDTKSASLGSIGIAADSVIIETTDGDLFSSVTTGTSTFSIYAGSRWTHVTTDSTNVPENVTTFNNGLGIAIVRNPKDRRDYYFGAAWAHEPNGIKSKEEFIKWVKKSANEFENPVIVNVK